MFLTITISQDLTESNLRAADTLQPKTPTLALSEVAAPADDVPEIDAGGDIDNYDGIDWKRLPDLQKPHHSSKRTPSWIFKYGYRCQSRVNMNQIVFICKYCHTHKIIDCGGAGQYDITRATSAAAGHLKANTRGHGYDKNGKITFESKKRQRTVLESLQVEGYEVSQAVANELIGGFNATRFRQLAIDWLIENTHPLREFETPAFRNLIAAANPEAERVLWRNHQSVADYIMAEYQAFLPSVRKELASANSLVHISFDGWTTRNGKHALTGICVHYLNQGGRVVDYLIALPEQISRHSGINYAEVVGNTLDSFNISKERLGYFVTDNASNNDTALDTLAVKYSFIKEHRRTRCACHVLNLVAQSIMWGKDKESFENSDENIPVSRSYIEYAGYISNSLKSTRRKSSFLLSGAKKALLARSAISLTLLTPLSSINYLNRSSAMRTSVFAS